MLSTKSRITQQKLDQALADIRQHISAPKDWQIALQELSSIKDYSMGEERFCSAGAALENCARIKGRFPPSTPAAVGRNLDSIAAEIESIRREETPNPYELVPFALAIIGIAAAVYWVLTR